MHHDVPHQSRNQAPFPSPETFSTPEPPRSGAKQGGNVNLFHRQKKKMARREGIAPSLDRINQVAKYYPVPLQFREVFDGLTAYEFLAAALLLDFILLHVKSGQGILDSVERYTRLQDRARKAAVRVWRLINWWSLLCDDTQVPHMQSERVLMITTMPQGASDAVLAEMIENTESVLMVARLWEEALREKSPVEVIQFDRLPPARGTVTLDMPVYSANAARHETVREPGMLHLLNALDLRLESLPATLAAMFYNGGQLRASEPSGVFGLTRTIREAYPLLALVGGGTDSFLLGASEMEVGAWIVCAENNEATRRVGIESDISVFDLLDIQTHTKHNGGDRVDISPMPFGFETLVPGTEIVLTYNLRPYATQMAHGALIAALNTFQAGDASLGGQGARGYGAVEVLQTGSPIDTIEAYEAYEAYLAAEKERLAEGLLSGTLTTGKVVCK